MTSLDVDEVKAAEMADKLAYLKDEEFVSHADFMAEKMAAFRQADEQAKKDAAKKDGTGTGTAGTTGAKQPPLQTNQPAPMAGGAKKVKTLGAEKDTNAANADKSVLDTAEPVKEPALATAGQDDGVQKVQASIVEYMAGYFDLPAENADDEK
jgi:hypothetical protein